MSKERAFCRFCLTKEATTENSDEKLKARHGLAHRVKSLCALLLLKFLKIGLKYWIQEMFFYLKFL